MKYFLSYAFLFFLPSFLLSMPSVAGEWHSHRMRMLQLRAEPDVIEHSQKNTVKFHLEKGSQTANLISELFLQSPKRAVTMEIQETTADDTRTLGTFGLTPNAIRPEPNKPTDWEDGFIQDVVFPPCDIADRYFKMVLTDGDKRRLETDLVRIRFLDMKKAQVDIQAAVNDLRLLSSSIPNRQLTQRECEAAGGRVNSGASWGYGDTVPNRVCEKGKPLGHIIGLKCMCICCK
jgi:hypothetical protein